MQADQANLQQAPDGHTLLPSRQKRADGAPRFTLSLPHTYVSDPGLALLAKLESQHAALSSLRVRSSIGIWPRATSS